MIQTEKAKVFRNGRSQAVRIPAQYRFSGDEVYIRRDKTGVITLSERPFAPSAAEIFRMFDEAGGADFELERDMSPPVERDLF
jgi:antitoxin VapB